MAYERVTWCSSLLCFCWNWENDHAISPRYDHPLAMWGSLHLGPLVRLVTPLQGLFDDPRPRATLSKCFTTIVAEEYIPCW